MYILGKNPTDVLGVTTGTEIDSDNIELAEDLISQRISYKLTNNVYCNDILTGTEFNNIKKGLCPVVCGEPCLEDFYMYHRGANAAYFTDAVKSVRILCGGTVDLHCLFRSGAVLEKKCLSCSHDTKKESPQRINRPIVH